MDKAVELIGLLAKHPGKQGQGKMVLVLCAYLRPRRISLADSKEFGREMTMSSEEDVILVSIHRAGRMHDEALHRRSV